MDLGNFWRDPAGSLKYFLFVSHLFHEIMALMCRKTMSKVLWQLFFVDALKFWLILRDFD